MKMSEAEKNRLDKIMDVRCEILVVGGDALAAKRELLRLERRELTLREELLKLLKE